MSKWLMQRLPLRPLIAAQILGLLILGFSLVLLNLIGDLPFMGQFMLFGAALVAVTHVVILFVHWLPRFLEFIDNLFD
jgi:hypothetical protein